MQQEKMKVKHIATLFETALHELFWQCSGIRIGCEVAYQKLCEQTISDIIQTPFDRIKQHASDISSSGKLLNSILKFECVGSM